MDGSARELQRQETMKLKGLNPYCKWMGLQDLGMTGGQEVQTSLNPYCKWMGLQEFGLHPDHYFGILVLILIVNGWVCKLKLRCLLIKSS